MAQFDVDKFLQQDDWSIPQLPNTCPVSPFYDAHSHPVPMPTLIDCFAIGTTAELWDLTCVDISESTAADNGDFLVDLGPLRLECETMQDARGFIVCELVETEQNFMGQLYLARHLFRNALKESRIVSEQTIDIVFRGTERLIPLHQALLHDLQDMIANWDRDSSLNTALVSAYSFFIASYMLSVKTEKDHQAKPEYMHFMNNQSKLAEAKRQQLKDLLPLPVQRVGRYPLLLKDLLKKTPETHPDYRNLTAAFDKVKELADRVNEKKKEEEEKTGLFEVYRETKDCPARLVSAKRRWINSYAAVDVKNKNKLQVSVFSDLIMISIVNKTVFKSDFKFKFSRWIDILELQITLANDLVLIEILPENASFSRPSNTWPNDIRSLLVAMPRMAEFINCAMLEKKLCVETEQQLFQAKLNLNP